jgi:hypothetical protein
MHPEIAKRFEAIEKRRKVLVDRVRALPLDRQNAKPGGKGFSPVEVIQHFALAEAGNVKFLRKTPPETLQGRKAHVTGIFRFTVRSMANPVKAVGTVGTMVPKNAVTVEEADRQWEEVRKETAFYLEQVKSPTDPFIKFLFFFGLGSANDYFDLMEAHLTYHEARFPSV